VNTLAEFGTGQLLWSMLWFFMFVIWFWLLITIFVYFIVRGKGMQERSIKAMQAQQAAQREYIQTVAGSSTTSASEEIARLADLRDKGAITEDEFQSLKAKALA
jgi:hypothetical protein